MRARLIGAGAIAILALAVVAVAPSSFGDESDRRRPHPIGFTEGFGNEKVLAFRYDQQFYCTDERTDDLDGPGHRGDGRPSAVDPDETQFPAMGPPGSPCIVGDTGSGSLPAIDPTGDPIDNVEIVWAMVPFFDSAEDADPIIEAVDPTPDGADVQCPEPGPPTTDHTGTFGTCTEHPSTLHAEPIVDSLLKGVLCEAGDAPPDCLGPSGEGAPVGDIPLPNHSHIIDGDNFNPIWWQTIAVRVNDEAIWPDVDGKCPANPEGGEPCLTSLDALREAQAAGTVTPDVASNLFLFFDSRPVEF
jgi:hypothetical protein